MKMLEKEPRGVRVKDGVVEVVADGHSNELQPTNKIL